MGLRGPGIIMLVLTGVLFLGITSVYAESAEEYYNKGIVCYRQENSPRAISFFSKAIERNPNFSEAYYNRGVIYYNEGSRPKFTLFFDKPLKINPLSQAISDFTRAVEINPNYAQAYYNRGNAYCKRGNLPKAISDFTRAVEIKPDYTEAYYNRALVYYTLKKFDNAWADVHKIEGLNYSVNSKFLRALKKASGRDK